MSPVLVASIVFAGLVLAVNRASASTRGGGGGMSTFVPKKARDQVVLEQIAAGLYVLPDFTPVVAARDGHVVEVYAANDALRVGAADFSAPRQSVSHELAQAIADDFGLMLPTTRMSDMAYLAVESSKRIGPVTMPSDAAMGTDPVMRKASERIDQAMASRGIPVGSFTRCCGKEWVTTEKLLEPLGAQDMGNVVTPEGWLVANVRGPVVSGVQKRFPNTIAGANFGWQWSQGASKTPGGLPCVQSVGRRHGWDHDDYSQLLTLYQPTCAIDGVAMNVVDVLLDPELAYLLSDEVAKGTACRVTRHPAT